MRPSRPFPIALLLTVCVALAFVGAANPAPTGRQVAASGSAKISARLTKKSFTSAEAGSVKLVCTFSKSVKHFSHNLQMKSGTKWTTVKSATEKVGAKHAYTSTVKKLFGGKAVKVGSYKLKISALKASKTLSFKVVKASGGGGGTGSAPENISAPTISGTTRQGQTLTAAHGDWSDSPTSYAYQWQRCGSSCSAISGATGNTYTLQAADTQARVKVVVTASNDNGSNSASSAQSALVSTIPYVSVHSNHSCALLANGTVKCFGANWNGQLGDGTTFNRSTPTLVSGLTKAVGVTTGDAHSCALKNDGTVWCWGYNGYGQLGSGTFTDSGTPVQANVSGAVQISAGDNFTCALLAGGTVKCWGANGSSQLGNGGTSNQPSPVTAAVSSVTQISAGDVHACALVSGGTVKCWGDNSSGQIGNGSSGGTVTTPATVVGTSSGTLSGVTSIGAGHQHTCAVAGGAALCWGFNRDSQLGDGSTTQSNFPVQVSGLTSGAVEVSAGSSHSCAMLTGDAAKCWGYNAFGQLGNGRTLDFPSPVTVSGLSNVTQVDAGNFDTCVRKSDGSVWCWGWNGYGELGSGDFVDYAEPTQVVAGESGSGYLTGASAISVGSDHACAIVSGNVYCWGYNLYGQLGNGLTGSAYNSDYPVEVQGVGGVGNLSGVTAISAGGGHTCALKSGNVYCWGYNFHGQLGNKSTSSIATPVEVVMADGTTPLSGVTSVAAGGSFTCAVVTGGGVDCWGDNGYGQLGNNAAPTDSTTPVAVSSLSGVTAISAGYQHVCVIAGSAVDCWGYNGWGELGASTGNNPTSPVPIVAGVSGASGIDAGDYHTCAVVSGGVKCWGDQKNGQLGNNVISETGTSSPVDASGISTATAVAAGRAHSCALLSDNTIKCWGWDGDGQLDNGVVTHEMTPVTVLLP